MLLKNLGKLALISLLTTLLSVAYANEEDTVSSAIRSALARRFPGSRIELIEETHWSTAEPSGQIQSVKVSEENSRGQVQLSVQSQGDDGVRRSVGLVAFAAYLPARMTVRRVLPGEKLQADQFTIQEINVASGPSRELRGVILSQSVDLSGLEARQTLVEGQALLSSAVQKIPDIRRGDTVRVQLVSNGLTLSTLGTASEPAYLNGGLHIVTQKSKRELAGKLISAGIVEVRL